MGSKLVVDGTHQFSDLDELIVNHVQAMARKVEELMMHEKFKPGTEDDLRTYPSLRSCLQLTLESRSVPEELRRCEPLEERVWFHAQSQAARAFQPLLPGK